MSVVAHNFKAESRKLYRSYTHIQVSPVSKGTWTVSASVGTGRRRQTRRWTGLDSLTAVEVAASEALDWAAELALV